MSESHYETEYERAVTALLDDRFTEADEAALDRLLSEHRELRWRYVRDVFDHTMLRWELSHGVASADREASEALDELAAASRKHIDAAGAGPTPRHRAPGATDGVKRRRGVLAVVHAHWRIWSAAAAIVLALPVIAVVSYLGHTSTGPSEAAPPVRERVATMMEISDDAKIDYGVSEAIADEWTLGKRLYTGHIVLRRGRVTLVFDSGAEVEIEGPAKFALNHPKRAFLHHGRITVDCPEQARGFTVGAPGVAVIDLGTQFTMYVDLLGFTEVAVLDGRVDLKRDSGEVVSLLRGASARAPRELTERLEIDGPIATAPAAAALGPAEQEGIGDYRAVAPDGPILFEDTLNVGSVRLHEGDKLGRAVRVGRWAYAGTWQWDTARIATDADAYLKMHSGNGGAAAQAVMAAPGALADGVTVAFDLWVKPNNVAGVIEPMILGYDDDGNALFELRLGQSGNERESGFVHAGYRVGDIYTAADRRSIDNIHFGDFTTVTRDSGWVRFVLTLSGRTYDLWADVNRDGSPDPGEVAVGIAYTTAPTAGFSELRLLADSGASFSVDNLRVHAHQPAPEPLPAHPSDEAR